MQHPRWPWLWLLVGLFCFGSVSRAQALIEVGATWRFINADAAILAANSWMKPEYSDEPWFAGVSGFGNTSYGEQTRFDSFPGDWSTVLLRKSFAVTDPATVRDWVMRVDFSDALIVYLNGVEVARRGFATNFPTTAAWPEIPLAPRYYNNAELISLAVPEGIARPGTNLLAVRVQGRFPGVARPVFVPELYANFTRTPYLQLATSNSVHVLWQTWQSSTGRVEIGEQNTFDRSFPSAVPSTNHEVAIEGLRPGTVYQYRVVHTTPAGGRTNPPQTFRTLTTAGNLTVAVWGDSGWGTPAQYAVARQLQRSGADLFLHTGDMVYPAFVAGLGDLRLLSVYRSILGSAPFYSVWGNHDFLYSNEWTAPGLNLLRFPDNGVADTQLGAERAFRGAYYSFEAGEVHFAMLFLPLANVHTLAPNTAQYRWLEADLAATRKPWKVIVAHHPMFTSSSHRWDLYGQPPAGFFDPQLVSQNVLPLARRHGVQLILSGHDHNYERFLPVDGIHCVVTGGGGAGLYRVFEYDSLNSQFHAQHHYTRLFFEGDTLRVRAVGVDGQNFDGFNIRLSASPPGIRAAGWQSPAVENQTGWYDGNLPGQSYDFFSAAAAEARTGQFANLGRLRVSADRTNLYLGLEFVSVPPDADGYIFLESPRQSGVTSLRRLGNGVLDPDGQGADAVDMLENLEFDSFAPSMVAVWGDEFADSTVRNFARNTNSPALGEGVFRLDAGLSSVPGIRMQQFNRAPQDLYLAPEKNADFVKLAIPRAALGGVQAGDVIQIGVVVGGGSPNPLRQSRLLDSGFVGEHFALDAQGVGRLRGVRFQLPADPDPDDDGLNAAQEAAAGTDSLRADTDGDGLPDGWEVRYGLSPLNAAGRDGAAGDADGDGLTNQEELERRTSPTDFASPAPELQWARGADGAVTLRWRALVGRRYLIEKSPNANAAYQPHPEFPRPARSTVEEITIQPTEATQFFRISVPNH